MKEELAVFRCSVASRTKMRRASSRSTGLRLCGNVCLLILLWSDAAVGQSAAARGSISGIVTDPQGSAVAGARVIVRNTDFTTNGFGVLGGNSLANWAYTSNISRFNDDLAITNGRATLHVGGGFAYDPARQRHEANLNGRFDFDSLADFLANDPRRYQQTFVVGDPFYDGAVKSLGLYADVKLALTKALTVTAGLRWDAQWNPQPTHSNPTIPLTTHIQDDLNQWQPRLGLAWNPATNTVVRLSTGLYDAPTAATYFQRVFTDNAVNTVVADSYYDPQILALVADGNALPAPPPGSRHRRRWWSVSHRDSAIRDRFKLQEASNSRLIRKSRSRRGTSTTVRGICNS